jgi:hypothetical protein
MRDVGQLYCLQASKHTSEVWTAATVVGLYCYYCLSQLMLCNSKDNASRTTTKNLFILAIHKLFYSYKSTFCVLYHFRYAGR